MMTKDGAVIRTPHDLQTLLFDAATDDEADTLTGLFLRVGLFVRCDNERCTWTNPPGAIGGRCEGCGSTVGGPQAPFPDYPTNTHAGAPFEAN